MEAEKENIEVNEKETVNAVEPETEIVVNKEPVIEANIEPELEKNKEPVIEKNKEPIIEIMPEEIIPEESKETNEIMIEFEKNQIELAETIFQSIEVANSEIERDQSMNEISFTEPTEEVKITEEIDTLADTQVI